MIINENNEIVALIKGEQTADSFLIEFEHNGKILTRGFSLKFDSDGTISGYFEKEVRGRDLRPVTRGIEGYD